MYGFISARSASTLPDNDDDDARSTFANEEAAASTTPIAAAFDGTASHAANDDRDCSTPPHAAAAINDDMRLAREIRIIDRLTSVYGFPYRSALDALEECGQHLVPRDDDDEYDDDNECVVACYNWILDNRIDDVGVVDSGGPVVLRTDCPHVKKCVRLRIVEMGMDGKMEATAIILGANDGGEERGGSTTIVQLFAGVEGIAMHRPGTTGGDRTDLMNVECQYHRYADRRRRVRRKRRRRRMRRTPSEGSPGERTPLPAVGRLKFDVNDDGFDDAHTYTNTFGEEVKK